MRFPFLCIGLMFAEMVVAHGQVQSDSLQRAIQLTQRGNWSEAEILLKQFVSQNPESPRGWMLLGNSCLKQKKLDEAFASFEKASQFGPTAGAALFNMGCVRAVQGRKADAIESLKMSRSAGFQDREKFLGDEDLTSLRESSEFLDLIPPLLEGSDLFVEPTRIIHGLNGENANDEFGWVARRVGDLDGDKITDFVATAPGYQRHQGKAYVYSGKTGTLLFSKVGTPGSRLGNSAASAGDVNQDGIVDIIIGAPQAESGRALVLSGRDGTVLHELRGEKDGDQFGYKVSGLGDIDGDRCDDFAITALAAFGTGRCYLYSGKNAAILLQIDGEQKADKFGSAVCGWQDHKQKLIAVGAQDAGPEDKGAVYLYEIVKTEAKLRFRFDSDTSGQDLGQMFLACPGDLNQDEVLDLYCSDFGSSKGVPGGGRALVLSGVDGSIISDHVGSLAGEGLGTSPSDAGDVDGDHVGDLVIGAWQNSVAARSAGRVYLYSGRTNSQLASWTCRQQGDTFGFDATGLGDVDGDGAIDFLLTSAWSPVVGPKTGRVLIIAGQKSYQASGRSK